MNILLQGFTSSFQGTLSIRATDDGHLTFHEGARLRKSKRTTCTWPHFLPMYRYPLFHNQGHVYTLQPTQIELRADLKVQVNRFLAPGYPTLLQEKAPTVQLQGSWILSNLPTSLPLEAIVTFQ
jgi:hypothetical protein